MSLALKLRLLPQLASARVRDGWSRSQLESWQRARLDRLVDFARRRSPFYAAALGGRNLEFESLPVLSKASLAGEWDRIVTDRALGKNDLLAFLSGRGGGLHLGRYAAMATSGTTGSREPFPFTRAEWAKVMLSVARLTHWRAGVGPGRFRTAYIYATDRSATSGAPMSPNIARSAIAMTTGGKLFDAAMPLRDLVTQLNRMQPQTLVGFASTLAILAEEQIAGRLELSLVGINSSSEVLSPQAAALMRKAFGVQPFDAYATTETGVAAASCIHRAGMHVLEDMSILEVVDEDYRPVGAGEFGSRVLVTNLWNRTLPLIRYEITDRVKLSATPCPCGLPFRLIEEIDGRAGDVLRLPAGGGRTFSVTPSQIQDLLHDHGITIWQIAQNGQGLVLRAVIPDSRAAGHVAAELSQGLADLGGSRVPVTVEPCDWIVPERTGKIRRFIKEAPHDTPP